MRYKLTTQEETLFESLEQRRADSVLKAASMGENVSSELKKGKLYSSFKEEF
jgi:hypothetical protein